MNFNIHKHPINQNKST